MTLAEGQLYSGDPDKFRADLARTAALTPALSNGHIDYTMSFLPPVDAALKAQFGTA